MHTPELAVRCVRRILLKVACFVFNSALNCTVDALTLEYLLSGFSLAAPQRIGRHTALFDVPFARVDSVLNGLFVGLPKALNECLASNPACDFFHDTPSSFKSLTIKYVPPLC